MKNIQINPVYLIIVFVLTFSCTGNRLKTKSITACFSDKGEITSIQLSDGRQLAPVNISTDLPGCKLEGAVNCRKGADGSFEFKKNWLMIHCRLPAYLLNVIFQPQPVSVVN